jgi:hypothetical protein
MTTSHVANQVFRQWILHRVESNVQGSPMTVESFLDMIRREVELVRSRHPELDGYHLYDLKIKFPDGNMDLEMEFRR